MQEQYFNCLTNASRCCDPLLQELDIQHEYFMNETYGGKACVDVKLNKMTDCIELRTFAFLNLPRMWDGNVFVCCLCVCQPVRDIFNYDRETSFLVWWRILTISGSSFSINVIESTSRSNSFAKTNFSINTIM